MTNGIDQQVNLTNIDQLIATIQNEFPSAGIRVTGRARTLRRQAELMAQRILANRLEFLRAYVWRQHIAEMNQWVISNPSASKLQTTDEFERIINRAIARGFFVSNHLSNTARDISWPLGTPQDLNTIETRINALGATVIREPNAAGGRHWHIDW